ncbi:MAG TPA: hypothetical protein VHE12_05745 [bacterium]|nr:hypothetical protein [bacterium]
MIDPHETPHTETVRKIYETLGPEEMAKIAREGVALGVERWLEKVAARFGRWTFAFVGALIFGLILKFLAGLIYFGTPPTH